MLCIPVRELTPDLLIMEENDSSEEDEVIMLSIQHRMRMCVFRACAVVSNSRYLFKESPDERSVYVDPTVNVRDVLSALLATPAAFLT